MATATATKTVYDETQVKSLLEEVIQKTNLKAIEAERDRRDSALKFTANGFETTNLSDMLRLSEIYARSDLVPAHFKGKPENVFIAMQMAQRLRADPFAVMQATYVVYGRPGIEGKLAIALLNVSGKIDGPIDFKFEGEGDDRKCTAFATDKRTGRQVECTVHWKTVVAEGWNKPKGDRGQVSKWMTMPGLMFRYRSASWLIKTHYPEVLMGLHVTDELEDAGEQDKAAAKAESTDDLAARLASVRSQLPTASGNGHAEKPAPTAPEPSPQDATPTGSGQAFDQPGDDEPATEQQFNQLDQLRSRLGVTGDKVRPWLAKVGAATLKGLTYGQAEKLGILLEEQLQSAGA